VSLLATALGLSLLGSFGGLLVASALLLFNESLRTRLVPWLISYAVGALLGVALLALIPEALEELSPQQVFGSLLAGIATVVAFEHFAG
jgi:zinc and cadmium transporter